MAKYKAFESHIVREERPNENHYLITFTDRKSGKGVAQVHAVVYTAMTYKATHADVKRLDEELLENINDKDLLMWAEEEVNKMDGLPVYVEFPLPQALA